MYEDIQILDLAVTDIESLEKETKKKRFLKDRLILDMFCVFIIRSYCSECIHDRSPWNAVSNVTVPPMSHQNVRKKPKAPNPRKHKKNTSSLPALHTKGLKDIKRLNVNKRSRPKPPPRNHKRLPTLSGIEENVQKETGAHINKKKMKHKSIKALSSVNQPTQCQSL